ncbi:MAG: hypothetical protein MI717_04640 [Spirochaetales bacterium]|nr:hypothetical protein [Spirochaetales bacterium]
MPIKLIAYIVAIVLVATFVGLNIGNTSDIQVWFGEKGLLKEVSISVSFFVMYLAGLLSAVPFFLGWQRSKKRIEQSMKKEETTEGAQRRFRVLGRARKAPSVVEVEEKDLPESESSSTSEDDA